MLYIPLAGKIAAPRPQPRPQSVHRFGLQNRLRSVAIDINNNTVDRLLSQGKSWREIGLEILAKRAEYEGKIQESCNHNIVVQDMLATIALSWYEARAAYVTQIGVGTGLTDPTDTDSGLASSLLLKSITEPIDESNLTGATPYTIATVQFNPSEANGNLTEAGQFLSTNALANRAMFGRGTVTDATQADPVEIESADHGLSTGDRVRFDGIDGMTQLNFVATNRYYIVVTDADHFELYEDESLATTLDGTGFTAFSAGANSWTLDIPKTSSRILQVSFEIQVQNA